MVGAVAAPGIAFVDAAILAIRRRQRTQAERRQQLPFGDFQYLQRPLLAEQTMAQADRDDLVGTNRAVAAGVADHVVKIATLFVPEDALEVVLETIGDLGVVVGGR